MRGLRVWTFLWVALVGCDCAAETGTNGDASADSSADSSTQPPDSSRPDSTAPSPAFDAELWYAVDDMLVYVEIDPDDGSVVQFVASNVVGGLEHGQNAITMLDDGSLLVARLARSDDQTHFYYFADPPRDGSDVTPMSLGIMPDAIMIEGLYSDCDGRIYAMDTGVDDTSSEGNRLLRFTGSVIAGDFAFVVVSDLSSADVADIDDMGPGINANQVTDNPGIAIDTSDLYAFNYETGTGTQVATGGTWGIHALGGDLFSDGRSRLYILSSDAELFEVDPGAFILSDVLGTGPPTTTGNPPGWTGLAGPLTECDSGFTLI